MKKGIKILLIALLVILIAVASLAVWQWKNIRSIYAGVNESAEEIAKRRNDNQTHLVDELGGFLESGVRELTQEEKEQIEQGSVRAEEVYLKVFEEKYAEIKEANKGAAAQTKDEIVSKYISQLYRLQSEYTAKAETTISQGANYYEELNDVQDKASARAATIKHFTPIVRALEAECDAEVETVISQLEKELKAIEENTDIIGTIRVTYENEKQLKLSYYANKYLK